MSFNVHQVEKYSKLKLRLLLLKLVRDLQDILDIGVSKPESHLSLIVSKHLDKRFSVKPQKILSKELGQRILKRVERRR